MENEMWSENSSSFNLDMAMASQRPVYTILKSEYCVKLEIFIWFFVFLKFHFVNKSLLLHIKVLLSK